MLALRSDRLGGERERHRSGGAGSGPLESLLEGLVLSLLREAREQILLERLTGGGGASAKGLVDLGGNVLDLDTGHEIAA
jgi:hypothetical protein